MRQYKVREYIEYIPSDEERQRYNLHQNVFYGEIEAIDEVNGIFTLESVTTTGHADEVECFKRKMTVLEAHKVNKLTFEVPPILQKAFKDQLDKEEKNQTATLKREPISIDLESGKATSSENKENEEFPNQDNQDDEQLTEQSEPMSDQNEEHPDQRELFFDVNEQIPTQSGKSPVESEEIPDESEQVPGESEQVPDESEQVPAESEEIPDESEQVPDESEQVPDESEQISEQSEQIPVQSEELSDDNEELSVQDEPLPNGIQNEQPSGKQQKKDSGKNKAAKRKRKQDPDVSKNINNTGLRRTARLHKPVYDNVMYERDNGAYCQVVKPVTYMTEEQCNLWFRSNFPTKKQAKSKGIQYFKRFRANRKMIKIYSSGSEDEADEDNSKEKKEESESESSLVRNVEEEGEQSDDVTYNPDEDLTASDDYNSEVTEGFSTSTDDDTTRLGNSSRKGKKKRIKETEISLKNISRKYTKKKPKRGDKKSLEKNIHKKNVKLNQNATKGRSKIKDSKEKDVTDSDSEIEITRSSHSRTKNSPRKKRGRPRLSSVSNSGNNKKPRKSSSRSSSSDNDKGDKKRDQKLTSKSEKIRKDYKSKEQRKKRRTISDSNESDGNSRKSKKKLGRPPSIIASASESSSGKENISKTRDPPKKAKPDKPLKLKKKVEEKVPSPTTVYSEEGNQIRRPLPQIGEPRIVRQPVDTPLTTKYASKNTPTTNSSLMRLFSPKVNSPKEDKQSVLNRCLRNLGEYSTNEEADNPGSVVYVQTPDLNTSAVSGIFALDRNAGRGPLDVDGDFMILKLTWGSATITINSVKSETQQMKLNEDIHLDEGSSYTMNSIRGALITFKCSLPPDESFVE